MQKPRLSAVSLKWVAAIGDHIRACNVRGPLERFRDVAADALDGRALRGELDDLIRRRMLEVIRYGYDDSRGRDPARLMDSEVCGTCWSVNPTEKFIRAFWSDRLTEIKQAQERAA